MKDYITEFNGHYPVIAKDAFIDISARLIGKVSIQSKASVWPGAVLRADEEEIIIGERSAVLDQSLLESPCGHPVIIETGALVSHNACIHGAVVKTGALIGIGAIVLDGAVIGEGALIGSGALITPGTRVPDGMLMLGQPAKAVRPLRPNEHENIVSQLSELEHKAKIYRQQLTGSI